MTICTHGTIPEGGDLRVTKQQVRRGRQAADVSPTEQTSCTQQHRDALQAYGQESEGISATGLGVGRVGSAA